VRALIIDGHNVMNASLAYRGLLARDHATARDRLVHEVASFAGGSWDTTIVFDGAGNPRAEGEPTDSGGVIIIYSPSGTSADTVVESLARERRDSGEQVRVVTSDADTGRAIMGPRVIVTSASSFLEQLAAAAAQRAADPLMGRGRTTIGDRLTPETRATLLRMRDDDG
jgi:predicted RNA-binding protein with PIN domain